MEKILLKEWSNKRVRKEENTAVVTHLYFIPVCFPVDSFKEM